MKRTKPGLFVVLLVLTACAAPGALPGSSDESPRDSPDLSPPAASDRGGETDDIDHATDSEAILVVDYTGGMAPVQFTVINLPTFVLLGDGRVIMQGPQTLEFPGPAYPALTERTLTEEGVQAVLSAVEDTNLFTTDFELRGAQAVVADASDTRFTLNAAGQEVIVSVYGLGMLLPDMEPPGMSSAELGVSRPRPAQ